MFGLINRPLSRGMIESLMEIHEREMLGQDLCDHGVGHIAGLYKRGMIGMRHCIRSSDQKTYMGFFATENGKKFLERITKEKGIPFFLKAG